MNKLVSILAICHTIIAQNKDDKLVYNASSPDELALTNAAKRFGVVFENRDPDNNIIILNKRLNMKVKYELLNTIEFTAGRKRMSVIVRTPEGKIICMTKGADSVIASRLRGGQENLYNYTMGFLDKCANEGFRTLLLAQKEVDPNFYEEWNEKWK